MFGGLVLIELRAEDPQRAMKSRSSRPEGDAEHLGDLVERLVQVVVEDHHGPVIEGQLPEGAFELVAIDDRADAVGHHRFVNRQQSNVRRPTTGFSALGIAGADEKPIRPSLEAGRVAQFGKVLPDTEQRLLGGVLGNVDMAQDPVRTSPETGQRSWRRSRRMPPRRQPVHVSRSRCPCPSPGLSIGFVPTLQPVWGEAGRFLSIPHGKGRRGELTLTGYGERRLAGLRVRRARRKTLSEAMMAS